MSHCLQTFSEDFLEFLLKRRHLKNMPKSANKFIKNKKFNTIMQKKYLILTLIIENISIEKYVDFFYISCQLNLIIKKKTILINVTTQMDDFECWLCARGASRTFARGGNILFCKGQEGLRRGFPPPFRKFFKNKSAFLRVWSRKKEILSCCMQIWRSSIQIDFLFLWFYKIYTSNRCKMNNMSQFI